MVKINDSLKASANEASRITNRVIIDFYGDTPFKEFDFAFRLGESLDDFHEKSIVNLNWSTFWESYTENINYYPGFYTILLVIDVSISNIENYIQFASPNENTLASSNNFVARNAVFLTPFYVEENFAPSREKWTLLQDYCSYILGYTNSSYIVVYTQKQIRILPASTILASGPIHPFELTPFACRRFYNSFFNFFIGDSDILNLNPNNSRNNVTANDVVLMDLLRKKYKNYQSIILYGNTSKQYDT